MPWPFSSKATSARNTTPARGGIAAHSAKRPTAKATTFKGYRIWPSGGNWKTAADGGESDFDTAADAKKFTAAWTKRERNPAGKRYLIPNPARPPAVTDRALRYRAHKNPPEGPEICHYCGAEAERLDLEHIDGREENSDPENLAWACRSCNTTKGANFAEEGIGRLTRQYNPNGKPARSVEEYARAVGALMGANRRQAPGRAIATVQATSAGDRARYARQLRRLVNPTVPTFAQYAWAVSQGGPRGRNHSGEHDEAGAIIHATPKSKRRDYARRIASARRTRRESANDAVPF